MANNVPIGKVVIKLNSLRDLIRLTAFLSPLLGIERPYIFLIHNDEKRVYFFAIKQFAYGYKPLIIYFYHEAKKEIQKKYVEYSKNEVEQIRFIESSEIRDPTKTYIAIYKVKKLNLILDPFKEDISKNIISVSTLSQEWVPKIKFMNLNELVRTAFVARNLLMVQKLSEDKYIYFTGLPAPITGLLIEEFIYGPVFYCISDPPLVGDNLAFFVSYNEIADEKKLEFKLGVDILENAVPLIYVKNHPLGALS